MDKMEQLKKELKKIIKKVNVEFGGREDIRLNFGYAQMDKGEFSITVPHPGHKSTLNGTALKETRELLGRVKANEGFKGFYDQYCFTSSYEKKSSQVWNGRRYVNDDIYRLVCRLKS